MRKCYIINRVHTYRYVQFGESVFQRPIVRQTCDDIQNAIIGNAAGYRSRSRYVRFIRITCPDGPIIAVGLLNVILPLLMESYSVISAVLMMIFLSVIGTFMFLFITRQVLRLGKDIRAAEQAAEA